MARTLTLTACAAALAPTRGQSPEALRVQLSRWVKRSGFPADRVDGETRLDADEVAAWIRANVRERLAREQSGHVPPVPVQAPATPPSLPKFTTEEQGVLDVLSGGQASPVELARAAVRVAASGVARGAQSGELTGRDMESLKKGIEELRRCEKEYLEIEETRGRLVDLEEVKAMAGEMARRLNASFDALLNAAAGQLELWYGDPAFRVLEGGERRRQIRAWVDDKGRQVRTLEAQAAGDLVKTLQEEVRA